MALLIAIARLAMICESDMLGERVNRRRQDNRRAINTDTLIRNPAELSIGATCCSSSAWCWSLSR